MKKPPPPGLVIAGITFRITPDGEYRAPGLRLHLAATGASQRWVLWSALGATFGTSPSHALAKHRARFLRAQKALGYR